MINSVRMNSVSTINNNSKAHSMAFKGREETDEPVFIDIDEKDNFEVDKQALNDLKEAKKNFEDLSNDNDNSKAVKGALKLGAVAISGVIAGSAFMATAPHALGVVKKVLNKKTPTKIVETAKKAIKTVAKPITSFVSAKTTKLAEYKGSLDTNSKKFKVLDKAETAINKVQEFALKAKKTISEKALKGTSVMVGASTSAEAYQEMKNEKEGGR